ncbi:MAG TPA: hypothetical protein VI451_21255 [Anaerolineales bacterium]|nr:hypothetical protein [Anaerolineales bacterium]
MKTISYLIAAALGFFGLVFIVGYQGLVGRLIIGVILLIAAGVMIFLARAQPQVVKTEVTVKQEIELTGDVELEQMTCNNCGAALSKNSIEVKAGAIFVNCEHCGTSYQIEEAPKW